ncbi:hypothetical protein SAMN05192534_105131 [Alteribacillus persepolensis]|uniref:Uncharacterized protein n=1 Tax=Alteribacillus persepolensis TaxID=568899 RepID=A0A1G8CC49_9BACI|nr:hypothetical protein [Alteribacillus persepolensis]SDH42919.1 hypothetical protein SAMN05192534_105131 [Alteribacillus persepolensis]
MAYYVYKGEVNHPAYQLPFIIYYDAYEESVCITTLDMNARKPSICQYQYPARSLHDVRTLINKMGANGDSILFKYYYLQ